MFLPLPYSFLNSKIVNFVSVLLSYCILPLSILSGRMNYSTLPVRKNLGFTQCLASIFKLHSETANTWTGLLSVYVVSNEIQQVLETMIAQQTTQTIAQQTILVWLGCSTLSLIASLLAHHFSALSASASRTLFRLDHQFLHLYMISTALPVLACCVFSEHAVEFLTTLLSSPSFQTKTLSFIGATYLAGSLLLGAISAMSRFRSFDFGLVQQRWMGLAVLFIHLPIFVLLGKMSSHQLLLILAFQLSLAIGGAMYSFRFPERLEIPIISFIPGNAWMHMIILFGHHALFLFFTSSSSITTDTVVDAGAVTNLIIGAVACATETAPVITEFFSGLFLGPLHAGLTLGFFLFGAGVTLFSVFFIVWTCSPLWTIRGELNEFRGAKPFRYEKTAREDGPGAKFMWRPSADDFVGRLPREAWLTMNFDFFDTVWYWYHISLNFQLNNLIRLLRLPILIFRAYFSPRWHADPHVVYTAVMNTGLINWVQHDGHCHVTNSYLPVSVSVFNGNGNRNGKRDGSGGRTMFGQRPYRHFEEIILYLDHEREVITKLEIVGEQSTDDPTEMNHFVGALLGIKSHIGIHAQGANAISNPNWPLARQVSVAFNGLNLAITNKFTEEWIFCNDIPGLVDLTVREGVPHYAGGKFPEILKAKSPLFNCILECHRSPVLRKYAATQADVSTMINSVLIHCMEHHLIETLTPPTGLVQSELLDVDLSILTIFSGGLPNLDIVGNSKTPWDEVTTEVRSIVQRIAPQYVEALTSIPIT